MRCSAQLPILILVLCLAGAIHAHPAAERYIPIGQSPGLSYQQTYIGHIKSVDSETYTLTVEDESGRHAVKVTPQSAIWLDRSQYRRSAKEGSFEDCRAGRRVEIKFIDDNRKQADWIKIESR